MLLPLLYLLIRSGSAGSSIWSLIVRPRTLQVLANSALLAGAVTLTSTTIAVPLGWLLVRTDLPGRRFWSVATSVPLAIPSLIGGFTFVAAFGSGGIVHQWLRAWLPEAEFPSIYGFGGAWILLTLLSYPYILLPVRASLRSMDRGQEETARSLGHTSAGIFWRVILPGLRPALLSGGLLVALYTLSDFAAVSLLQFDSFTRAIYVQYQASFNRNYAAVLSLLLVMLTGGILLLESVIRGSTRFDRTGSGTGRQVAPITLGVWRWPAFAACTLLLLLAIGLPVGVTVYWLIRGIVQGEVVTFSWEIVTNSVGVSLAAAIAAVLAALPVTVLAVRFRSAFTALLERSTYVGYALPGIVVALSLVFFGARYGGRFYQSIWMLIFAYLALFLPQAVTTLKASMAHINPNVENVARSLGHTPAGVLLRVTIPLLWPGILSGGALVFLTVMKELPATLLLSPIGFRTLATGVWSSVSEAFYARAALPALLLILASSLSLAFLLRNKA